METQPESPLARVGVDGVALKPTEHRLSDAADLPVDLLTIDFEGRRNVPDDATLRTLASDRSVRVTVPVRADGFDPLGDDAVARALPAGVDRVLVAGHPAYLRPAERRRTVGPRLRAAAASDDPWIGTEGVERLALAVGGTQFELLSDTTERDVRTLRRAGVEAAIAVYAPTVLTADPDTVLDAVGAYVARRGAVASAIPDDAPTDSAATGPVRERLLAAAESYALVGDEAAIAERIAGLRDAGVDTVVAYPAGDTVAIR